MPIPAAETLSRACYHGIITYNHHSSVYTCHYNVKPLAVCNAAKGFCILFYISNFEKYSSFVISSSTIFQSSPLMFTYESSNVSDLRKPVDR